MLSLLVSWFLMTQALNLHFLRRRPLIAQLRIIGVSARQLRWRLFRQAAGLGLGGSIIGLVIGWALANGMVQLLTTTMADLYGPVAGNSVYRPWWVPLAALGLGLGVSLSASILPIQQVLRPNPDRYSNDPPPSDSIINRGAGVYHRPWH